MRRSLLPYVVLCAAAAIGLSGCGQNSSPHAGSTSTPQPQPTAMAPATTRGLAAAALSHFPAEEIGWVGGEGGPRAASVSFTTKDQYAAIWSLDVWPPTEAPSARHCGHDLGYHVVTCRTLPTGDRIEVSRGPARSHAGATPILIGRAYRTDGSQILIEVHAVNSPRFPIEQAVRLLSDRLVGWGTSPALNEAGRKLRHFHRTRSYARMELLDSQ